MNIFDIFLKYLQALNESYEANNEVTINVDGGGDGFLSDFFSEVKFYV